MLTGRTRGNISLTGINYSVLSLKGLSQPTLKLNNYNILSQDYLDFKLKVIKNYIEPLLNKEYEKLRYNYHMIEQTLENIKRYSNEQNKTDIELFVKILKVVRNTIDIHVSYKETESKLYGSKGISQLMVRTSRIVLNAKYEIYNNLFGPPDKENEINQRYDDGLVERIDSLLKTLNEPTFENIRYELRDRKDLFLSFHKRELEKLIGSS